VEGWRARKKLSGGGPLLDLGAHLLDLALFFLGFPEPVAVSCSAQRAPGADVEVESYAAGFVWCAGGATIDFQFGQAPGVRENRGFYDVMGTRGGICMQDLAIQLFTEIGGAPVRTVTETPPSHMGLDRLEFEHFAQCVRTGAEPLSTAAQALAVMKIVDAAYRSAETGRETGVGGRGT
jgi:predicted dehydrogenase